MTLLSSYSNQQLIPIVVSFIPSHFLSFFLLLPQNYFEANHRSCIISLINISVYCSKKQQALKTNIHTIITLKFNNSVVSPGTQLAFRSMSQDFLHISKCRNLSYTNGSTCNFLHFRFVFVCSKTSYKSDSVVCILIRFLLLNMLVRFSQVIEHINNLFFFIVVQCPIIWIYHNLSVLFLDIGIVSSFWL